jgi:hypothetical protein
MTVTFRKFAIAMASGLIAATLTPQPAMAQEPTALAALEQQLPGTLVNNPSRIDWESYGADMEARAIVDKTIPGGGAARQFRVKQATEFIYTAGTLIPLTKAVNRGDQVTVGFYARTLEAKTDNGKGVIRVRFQQNADPFPGYGEKTLEIGNEWEWYEVTAEAEFKLRKRDGIVAIQFGRTRQTIEIGQAIIVSGANKIAGDQPVIATATADLPDLEMPEGLEKTGALINNPSQAAWKFGGSTGTWANRDETSIWMAKATRFKVDDAASSLTDLSATVPIEQPIEEGDELEIAIMARTINASTANGKAVAATRIQGTQAPFDSFAANRFTVGPKWQMIRISTKAPRAYPIGDAELQLYFAGSQQEVDLGPVYIFKKPK